MVDFDERLQIEAEWHDRVAWEGKRTDLIYGLPFQHAPLQRSRFLAGKVGENKALLEIGCGGGDNLLEFSHMGVGKIYGIDVSERAIVQCRRVITDSLPLSGIANVQLFVGDVHALCFESDFVDVIYGNAILHHLDLPRATKEIYRCLKKGGVAIFCEPLGHNIFINMFRWLTPWRRTPTERPLTINDIKCLEEVFEVKIEPFYFLPVIAFTFGVMGLPKVFKYVFDSLEWIEKKIKLNVLFRKYCWMAVLICRKH